VIRIEGLTVTFGRTVALDSIDLIIEDGATGLFGPNGSGKSTLLRAVAGLLRPTSGNVTIHGNDVRAEESRRQIGYAGHSAGLYRDLTVAENLELFARLYGVPTSRVNDVLVEFALLGMANVRAGNLSAGIGRRAAVARAMVHEPTVLLLDEPYANVDEEAAELTSSAIREWRGRGRVAIVASHGAKRVKAYADAGVILGDGRVRTAGRYRRAGEVVAK
jgi:heme exporter protein A